MQIIDDGLSSHYTFTSVDLPYNKYFSVTQGQKVRAVIRWDSKTYSNPGDRIPYSDVLEADLDLNAYDPSGNLVAQSNSLDNNYEIVEFTANTTGNYRVQIVGSRFDGSSEYVGLAIYKN